MAKIYGDADGNIIRLLQTDDEEKIFGAPATAYTAVVELDADTNADVIKALLTDWNSHSMPGGVLTRNGQAVTIAADNTIVTDRRAMATLRSGLVDYYKLASPTNAQNVAAIKAIIRLLGLIFDYYLKTR
jgi:hypothetical protein